MFSRGTLFLSVLSILACCADAIPLVAPTAPLTTTPSGSPTPASRATSADVLLHVDFENDPVGPYSPERLTADWGPGSDRSEGLKQGRASIVASDRGKSLRVLYPERSVGPEEGGLQFFAKLAGNHDDLYCSYRVRFASGFDFVRGGKLPGLVGGSHPTGGKPADDGFSARLMWRPFGAAVQYVYYPHQPSKYGVDLPYLPSGEVAHFRAGAWVRVEHHVVMNTSAPILRPGELGAGSANGVLQGWFDGQLALDLHDRVWRLDNTVHVDAFYFSTFFGGNDGSWGARRDESVDFDDFVISKRPIGQ
jgi:hypothetical protein